MQRQTHWHHIIPKHAGGTDEPSNLVELTIPEHAEAHRILWVLNGKLEDKMAWLALSQQTDEAELVRKQLVEQARKPHSPETKLKISNACKGKPKPKSEDVKAAWRAKISTKMKGRVVSDETRKKMSLVRKGRKMTPEHKMNISLAHQKRKQISSK